LRRESAEARYRIAELENLSRIRERASLLGLGPPLEVEYLYISFQKSGISSAPIKEADLLSPAGDDQWGRVLSFLRVLLLGGAKSEGSTEAVTENVGEANEMEIVDQR
jgi:hypothetical protein